MKRVLTLGLLSLLVITQAQADDVLAGNVPQGKDRYKEIHQGRAGTCWIDASMAALQFSGVDLPRRVVAMGKNRYEVTVHNWNNSKKRPTGGTHQLKLQVVFNGKTIPADPKVREGDRHAYWVVILHRAVIKAVHQWDPSQTIKTPHSGSGRDALAILTGRTARDVDARAANAPRIVGAALKARKAVIMLTKGTSKSLVKTHYYAVLGTSAQGVTLYNPWGRTQTVAWNVIRRDGNCFSMD